MSHVATIALEFRDPAALAEAAAACGFGLGQDTVTFYDGTRVTGTAIRLPGWQYPVVVVAAGRLHYDHYEGRWGDLAPPLPSGVRGGGHDALRARRGLSDHAHHPGRRHGPPGAEPVRARWQPRRFS
jgi:hypothetical protein